MGTFGTVAYQWRHVLPGCIVSVPTLLFVITLGKGRIIQPQKNQKIDHRKMKRSIISCVHISTKTRTRQAEARYTRTYAFIASDSRIEYARGKLKRRPITVCLRMKLSLKYRLQADSVRSASDRTEAVFLSSVTRLHCYVCLASACLMHVFVLMWTQLYMIENLWSDREIDFWTDLSIILD